MDGSHIHFSSPCPVETLEKWMWLPIRGPCSVRGLLGMCTVEQACQRGEWAVAHQDLVETHPSTHQQLALPPLQQWMDRQQPGPRDDAPPAWEMRQASHSVGTQANRGATAQQLLFTSAAIQQKAALPSTLQMELEEDHVQPPA
eukprot:379547-Rhodomonas_salina.1